MHSRLHARYLDQMVFFVFTCVCEQAICKHFVCCKVKKNICLDDTLDWSNFVLYPRGNGSVIACIFEMFSVFWLKWVITEKNWEAFFIEFRGTEGHCLFWPHCRFWFDPRIVLNWSICVHICPFLLLESKHLVVDSVASKSGFVVLSAEVPGLAS